MKLVWKLLKQHISVGQFVGFFFANLCGMLIILLSVQFYRDVKPAFEHEEGFLSGDYLIVSKRISLLNSLSGPQTFSPEEIDKIRGQKFCRSVGNFTPTQFQVRATLNISQVPMMSTEMFFESVPDEFVDVKSDEWKFTPESEEVPIILPKSYLALYNFGFAQSQSLPQITESLVSRVPLQLTFSGLLTENFSGRVIGFSDRLNTILAPESFVKWANARYAPTSLAGSTRLIVKVDNPADDSIMKYFDAAGYDVADNKLDTGRAMYFLRLISGIVIAIGLIISALSFYILMLSIFLLVQKNARKIQNLLLIGYSPKRVALPYQMLSLGLNLSVFLLSIIILIVARHLYLPSLSQIFSNLEDDGVGVTILVGFVLFLIVSVMNFVVVKRKVKL